MTNREDDEDLHTLLSGIFNALADGRGPKPVVTSAAEVLDSKARIGRCRREGCDVLFVRRNPGPPRKWCCWDCGHRVRERHRYHNKVKPYRLEIEREAEERLEAERGKVGQGRQVSFEILCHVIYLQPAKTPGVLAGWVSKRANMSSILAC